MKRSFLIIALISLLVASCSFPIGQSESPAVQNPADQDTPTAQALSTQFSTSTAVPTPTVTLTEVPTSTQPSPTITPTPWVLNYFTTTMLNPGVSPVEYLQDTCTYLENRWAENKSTPGTIVVPIMFHSIAKPGREITDSTTISTAYFEYFMAFAKQKGFSTITMDQLVGFLEENEKIPEHSMIMILDDRRPGVTELFMPYLEENDWTLTLAWPTTDLTSDSLWARMENLADSGRLDVQSHGHNHIYIQDYTPVEEIQEEIYKPIEVIQKHFGTTPVSIIWPGGDFTDLSVQIAEKAGLKLGFTVYSRGPLMFNWIPLGDPEKAVDDPLLVLPRFWSTGADIALEKGLAISEAAKKDADLNKSEELRYYELYCQPGEGN